MHSGEPARIAQKLTPLNLGAVLLTSERRTEGGQWKTRFSVPKMDCPSEENLIRMALADASAVAALDFDLKDRVLTVQHGEVRKSCWAVSSLSTSARKCWTACKATSLRPQTQRECL